MDNVFLASLLIISATILCALAIYGFKKSDMPGAGAFSLLMLAMAIHSFGYAFELLAVNIDNMYSCIRIEYLGASFYPFLTILFSSKYSDEKKIANKFVLLLFFLFGLITFILVGTNGYHFIYYKSMTIDNTYGFNILVLEKGIWYFIQVILVNIAMLYSIVLLFIKVLHTYGDFKKRVLSILIGFLIPYATVVIYLLGKGPGIIDFSPFSYLFLGLLVGYGALKNNSIFYNSITHEAIFNLIDEAVFVTDKNGCIINYNSATKKMFSSFNDIKIGQEINDIRKNSIYKFNENTNKLFVNKKVYKVKNIVTQNKKSYIYVITDITSSEKRKEKLNKFATEDALTGLYNRRYFMEIFDKVQVDGVFIIIDLDHFKNINDQYGHTEGDKVLHAFGVLIKRFFRNDTVCRYGGEEFALFIPNIDIKIAYNRVEEFRINIIKVNNKIKYTFSAGISKFNHENINNSIIIAEKKLYEAKENGRNQVKY